MKLRFLGAATTVTGSQFLLETDRARVLIEWGEKFAPLLPKDRWLIEIEHAGGDARTDDDDGAADMASGCSRARTGPPARAVTSASPAVSM